MQLALPAGRELGRDARGELLPELDAPLVERVDVPDRRLREDAVLVEREQRAERRRIEPLGEDRRRRAGSPASPGAGSSPRACRASRSSSAVRPNASASACANRLAASRSCCSAGPLAGCAKPIRSTGTSVVPWCSSWNTACCAFVPAPPQRIEPVSAATGSPVGGDPLPVRLHPELLEVRRAGAGARGCTGRPRSSARRRSSGTRRRAGPKIAGRFPPSGALAKVLVQRVRTRQELAEVPVADRDHEREADGGPERRAPADPVPDAEHVLGRDPDRVACLRVRGDADEVGGISPSVLEPGARAPRVLDRLERRHRLRDDDEERLRRIEPGERAVEVGRVDVRDEAHAQARIRVRAERLVCHRRPEVAPADPDVDDGADRLRSPRPRPRRTRPCGRAPRAPP